ncbi:hypothetical protein [Geodermatophilus sp. FMUSA9-8]|uniref:hypothetical protein n=1 Tax=Geodermatophilus sp. FMUSA9-8 TaxID=3120155 RepID=UPI00300B1EE3
MTEPSLRQQLARSVLQRSKVVSSYPVPMHVVVRLVYAMGDQHEVAYLDAHSLGTTGKLSGQITIFTERHLHVADYVGVSADGFEEDGTVTVTTIPRRLLQKLEIAAVEGTQLNHHDDWTGGSLVGSWWPGALTLTYQGHPKPITIGRGRGNKENILPLHATLLNDLIG